jgi:hypothetical protein
MTAALAFLWLGEAAGCKDSNTTILFDANASDGKGDVATATETGAGDAQGDRGAAVDSGALADSELENDAAPTDAEPGQ